MLHFLAYGNSDQASFRDSEVRKCFDILTVPSTIASYYSDATAAFVLSSQLEYMVEPRTPLFQETLREPRASHYTLAAVMGDAVNNHIKNHDNPASANGLHFSPNFYSNGVCQDMVASIVNFQRQYGERSRDISKKLDRYRRLLATASGESHIATKDDEQRHPTYVLCPYFAVQSFSDDWWKVMDRVWTAAKQLSNSKLISPVVSMSNVSLLKEAIESVPDLLSSTIFFWIPSFDEKRVESDKLYQLTATVVGLQENSALINLYGGYFSIMLSKLGLAGFNNGLGYSESREWPVLDSTGAAPARYYLRRLHAYVPTATATAIIEADSDFACSCSVCDNKLPNDLSYHELKKHFALARKREMDDVETTSLQDLCMALREDSFRFDRLRNKFPSGLRIPTEHLTRWAEVLESFNS